MEKQCDCGSTLPLKQCCSALIAGERLAKTAEELMRSRYYAYKNAYAAYVYKTATSQIQANNSQLEIEQFINEVQFFKLDIKQVTDSTVEFIAHYFIGDTWHQLHERSTFIQQNKQWLYASGELFDIPSIVITRNTFCPCNSGKKFKRCHGL